MSIVIFDDFSRITQYCELKRKVERLSIERQMADKH